MTAQPGERTVSWLDEDDPNRGSVPFMPVESVIELTPSGEESPPPKKSRREKAPKPSRGKLWRRDKATQEKPPREHPPRDVTPRAGDWPAPASEEWLTTLRGPAPRDARPAEEEWSTVPDEAPRTGPHPSWAAGPEETVDDDGWTTTPPLRPPPAEAPAGPMTREDWFTPRADDRPQDQGWDPPREADPEPDYRTGWNEDPEPAAPPEPTARPDWVASPEPAARTDWASPEPAPRSERAASPKPAARPEWAASPEQAARPDWARSAEPAARPDWVTSPVPASAPAAAPEGGWPEPAPSDAPVPEAWPAPLDITPDDDLPEPPAKRRRGPRSTGPTGGRPPGRPGRRRKPLMLLAIALTAAVVGAAVVAAASAYRLVLDGGGLSHTIAAPLGGRTQAELELESGAAIVTVLGTDLGDDLFQVTTPDSDDAVPRATIDGDRTTVRATSDSGEGASAVEVRLNSRVTWRLTFRGGAKTQTVDLSGGRLAALDMEGGATRLELILPKPTATVPIRLRGGLDELFVHAPTGVPTRVKVTKGATNVTLDRFNRSKVAPDTTFTPNGWGDAKARYDVDAAEGIGTVKLDRR
ncbi:hypothetical protein ACTMTJ_17450 [Phytohabitans sp. LJ34]|uniref:hypothetical protein n=1 Tax=Phytohabitans sp. LJ34 TaxID=3452217 RepID=UPI003F8CAF6A